MIKDRHYRVVRWHEDRAEVVTISLNTLVIAGWTGRDPVSVAHHVKELEAIGVKPPVSIPCFYRASVDMLTTEADLQFLGPNSSGEIEIVLVSLDDGLWVGLGSDHTDRTVESYSVPVSKQLCHKPLAPQMWRFEDVATHWDEMELRSFVTEDDGTKLYQEGTVASMREPADLIELYAKAERLPVGTAMFCGTLAAIGGVRPSRDFQMQLNDPIRKRQIVHSYQINPLPLAE